MKIITSFWCKKPTHITRIIIGDTYEYQPSNPAATRNRGRQCILLSYDDGTKYENSDNNATVKWLDTKRQGYVNITNLIHIDDMKKTPEDRAGDAQKRSNAARAQMIEMLTKEGEL
ncbi:MAG: hypothetical protein PHT07_10265 [Paludibacter sp.]|nr:hypothetical protein [Paludibacter sp.]